MKVDAAVANVRAACLAQSGATEKLSHGSPCWFVGGKQFAAFDDHHHGDGRIALWLCAPDGMQQMLVEAEPDHYFVPPYVGVRGWIGVWLDRAPRWSQIAALIEQAALARRARTARKPGRLRSAR